MPVRVNKAVSVSLRNGVGLFAQPCHKIVLRYCNWGGSSRGMREFLRTSLKTIAEQNPKVEFVVRQQPGHPIVQGVYAGGLSKPVCVRNYNPSKILEKIQVVQNASGHKLQKYNRAVESTNESVRGIWSPFHVDKESRHRV